MSGGRLEELAGWLEELERRVEELEEECERVRRGALRAVLGAARGDEVIDVTELVGFSAEPSYADVERALGLPPREAWSGLSSIDRRPVEVAVFQLGDHSVAVACEQAPGGRRAAYLVRGRVSVEEAARLFDWVRP